MTFDEAQAMRVMSRANTIRTIDAEERQILVNAWYVTNPSQICLPPEEHGDTEMRYARTMRQARFMSNVNSNYQSASLSAAMMLVPDGWTFASLSESDRKGWFCELRKGYLTSYSDVAFSDLECVSPAMAVTAASLKAHVKDAVRNGTAAPAHSAAV